MVGETLDRYTIESKLGEGGMGVVYRARDTHLDRFVAIKVLPPDKVADADRKQRFVQEAKAASALNHPGIVTIYDIRSQAGIDFIVMEYAPGRTLDQIIPPKGLGVGQALRFGVQIADALSTAHEAGIIHRDLKPSNVMVTEDNRIKILDFGLAKLLDRTDAPADARTRSVPMTEAGVVVGTAAYMSPEQAEGRKVEARSDIFSFGSVLYEMVTGRRPFVGDSSLSVLAKVLNDDPTPPSQIAASVPPDVERAILRCLRKDPARRYQTMADLKVALEDFASDSDAGQSARTSTLARATRPWRWAWAALIPVLLAVAYVTWQTTRTPNSPTPLRALPLTSLHGTVRNPSFAPDGERVAFAWSGPRQDNPDIYVQQIGAGSPLRLTTDPGDDYSPVWSPDGRSIAFLRRQADSRLSELRLVPPLGGPERTLTEIRPHGAFLRTVTLGWCPDSTCVVVTDARDETSSVDALFVVSVDTGTKRQLTHPRDLTLADTDPAMSPDGRWLAFRRDTAPFNGQLQLLAIDSGVSAKGEPRSLTPTALFAYSPAWLPDSTGIVFSAKGALWRLAIGAGSTAERLPFVGEDGIMPVVSRPQPGGRARLAYLRSFADSNIWRIERASAAAAPPVVAIVSTRRDEQAEFSPDAQRVVFTSDRSGELEIWAADASGGNPIQLASLSASSGAGRWSPDGKTIAFHSNPDGQGDVFVVAADGGKPRNLTNHPATDVFPSFSGDGRWIYFSSTRAGEPAIWKLPVSGGDAVRVSPGSGLRAIESPDRAFLYYPEATSTDRPSPLLQLSLKDGVVVRLPVNVASWGFCVIEGGIYHVERAPGDTRIMYFDLSSHRSTVIARNLGNAGAGLTASPDGRSLLFSRVDSSVNDLMLVESFR